MKVTEAKIAANRKNAQSPLVGRPVGSYSEARNYAAEAKRLICRMVDAELTPMVEAMIEKVKKGDVVAFTALLDRAHGKPAQAVEVSGKDGNPIIFMPLELIKKHSLQSEESVAEYKLEHETSPELLKSPE